MSKVTVVRSAILKIFFFFWLLWRKAFWASGIFFAAVPRVATNILAHQHFTISYSTLVVTINWLHPLTASPSCCQCPRLLSFPSVRPHRSSLSPLITPSVLPLWMRLLAALDVMCAADRRRLCLCHGGSFLNQVCRLLKDLNYRGKPHQTCNHTHLCSHGLHTNHAASHVMSGFFLVWCISLCTWDSVARCKHVWI